MRVLPVEPCLYSVMCRGLSSQAHPFRPCVHHSQGRKPGGAGDWFIRPISRARNRTNRSKVQVAVNPVQEWPSVGWPWTISGQEAGDPTTRIYSALPTHSEWNHWQGEIACTLFWKFRSEIFCSETPEWTFHTGLKFLAVRLYLLFCDLGSLWSHGWAALLFHLQGN